MPRARPHFKVFTTAKNHQRLAQVYQDNDLFALWTRLGIEAIERFADRTNDSFLVSDRELMALTGKGRADVARTLLRRLSDVSPISAEREGQVWRITFPNLAKKQGFKQENGKEQDPPSNTTSTATSKEIKRVSVYTPSGTDPKLVLPDPFPSERALAEWIAAADGLPPQARGSPDRAAAWAVGNVRAWTEAEGSPAACRKRTLRGWTKTIQNAIRKGWALDGFSEAETERTRALVAEYESRHSGQHMTPKQIEKDLQDPRVRSMLI